jgi:hypothetical protein
MEGREQQLSTADLASRPRSDGEPAGTADADRVDRREETSQPLEGDTAERGDPAPAAADATDEPRAGDEEPTIRRGTATDDDSAAPRATPTDADSAAPRDTATDDDSARRDTSLEAATAGDGAAEPGDAPASTGQLAGQGAGESDALLPRDENTSFQRRWEEIQTGFVDEPRRTVEEADELVALVMKRLAEGFAAERERLEQQWGRGEDISTEDLRIALQRYRDFFQRLLSA